MKVWATLGALLALLTGEQGAGDPGKQLAGRPPGYSIDGGDFYVWDEDPDEAKRWATELAGSRTRRR